MSKLYNSGWDMVRVNKGIKKQMKFDVTQTPIV